MMQINHRELVEHELKDGQTVGDAVGAAMTAGMGAATAADLLGAGGRTVAGVGLAVGVVGFLADAGAKHIAHTLTTDVRITETFTYPDGASEAVYHDTMIVSGASKANLHLGESLPALISGTREAVSHIFP